jgi:hypothetical protein
MPDSVAAIIARALMMAICVSTIGSGAKCALSAIASRTESGFIANLKNQPPRAELICFVSYKYGRISL